MKSRTKDRVKNSRPRSAMIVLFTLLTIPLVSNAQGPADQDAPKTFKERVPLDILTNGDQFITLNFENDSIGEGTDQNYTSGVRLSWFDAGVPLPAFADELADYVPTFDINETTSVSYAIGHNLYTPENIAATMPDPEDRPYAAFLYGTAGLSTITDNHIDDLEVTLGVVGPWAQGEEIQRFVHDLIPSAKDPKGWDAQLENEPVIGLSWQRRFPEAYAKSWRDLHVRVMPHAGLTLGNVYTYAAVGGSVQLTPKEFRWQSQPLRVKPAIPGSGFFAVPKNRWAWSLFTGLEGRAIARNLFLDGNTFRDSPSVDKKHLVLDANAGASLTYGSIQISYTLNYRTEEFHGQDGESLFGALSVGYRF